MDMPQCKIIDILPLEQIQVHLIYPAGRRNLPMKHYNIYPAFLRRKLFIECTGVVFRDFYTGYRNVPIFNRIPFICKSLEILRNLLIGKRIRLVIVIATDV